MVVVVVVQDRGRGAGVGDVQERGVEDFVEFGICIIGFGHMLIGLH